MTSTLHAKKSEQTGEDQSDVISFLEKPDSYPWAVSKVEKIETHGALVFLAGSHVIKIKKAVRFSYMDFSTLAKREEVCRREYEVNKSAAPQVYIGAVAITRDASGLLAIDGSGVPVEWCVHMHRFDEADVLLNRARTQGISPEDVRKLGDMLANFHKHAQVDRDGDSVAQMSRIVRQLSEAFSRHSSVFEAQEVARFDENAALLLQKSEHSLRTRAKRGFVRRCHGDLHLNNIVMIDDKPVLFDAIEFDEKLATIDTFYDLAFLLMDMMEAGLYGPANLLLNRYLYRWRSGGALYGLASLPLFLSCRAGIRAMVAADRSAQVEEPKKTDAIQTARSYFSLGKTFMSPPPPGLVVIGGISGTGKSTLAASIAPFLGAAPGALHLRSDLERKAMARVGEMETLPARFYTPEVTAKIYAFLTQKASVALSTGHSVIIDAVYLQPHERADIEVVARSLKIPFTGLWLTAPRDVLTSRVTARTHDASDATAEIVDFQRSKKTGPISWAAIDASGSADDTLTLAVEQLKSLKSFVYRSPLRK